MPKKIKADSTAKIKIKPTRKAPPGSHEGIREEYLKLKNLEKQNDSLKRRTDSLEQVIIELKGKLKKQ